jgi:hypothetical protein
MSASIVDHCELIAWRTLEPRIVAVVNAHLAAYGDRAPDELKQLQHEITAIANEREALGVSR